MNSAPSLIQTTANIFLQKMGINPDDPELEVAVVKKAQGEHPGVVQAHANAYLRKVATDMAKCEVKRKIQEAVVSEDDLLMAAAERIMERMDVFMQRV